VPTTATSGKDSSGEKTGLGVGLGLGIPLVLALTGIACWTMARRRGADRATAVEKPPQYPQASPAVAQQPNYYVMHQPAVQGVYPELPATEAQHANTAELAG
jgi:hypothetical protein